MRIPCLALLAAAAAASASAAAPPQPCLGEYSRCASGACALTVAACGQCAAGAYACPLSSSCAASAAAVATSCPGLANTLFDTSLSVEARLDRLFAENLTIDELTSQMTDNATEIPRLSIPAYVWLNDDQHGVKQPDATAFPNGNSLGASWDTSLLKAVGLAIGVEARGTHNSLLDKSASTGGTGWPGTLRNGAGLTAYAPNLNLVHDPRWGRAQEVMGECPLLTGALVASYVNGMQNSSDANAETGTLLMAACCKHFAIYNVETIPTDRTLFTADVGARDLFETYLPAFEQCIVAGHSQSVMCSYNSLVVSNVSVPTCASPGLLTTILRSAWNFTGFVVSDYDAWKNIVDTHHYAPDYESAAIVGLRAGLDQEGGGGPTYPPVQQGLPAAVAAGRLQRSELETSVRRLLRVRVRLGMFDPPTSNAYNAITHASVASPAHLALAESAARAGMTLLRNNVPAGAAAPALPLSLPALAGKRIALLGPSGNASYILLGSYSDAACCAAGIPTVLAELGTRANAAGVALDYAPGCVNASCLETDLFPAAAAVAAAADAVVLVLGTGQTAFACGGNSDTTACESEAHDRASCALPGGQPALVAAVRAALRPGVPLVAVLVHGGALCITADTLGALDGMLDAWFPGMRGAAAIADALLGAYSPAGRSPVSFYASDAALPADRGQMSPYADAATGSPGLTYRFYDEARGAPRVITFGEGLSYTTFSVTAPVAPAAVAPCAPIALAATVRNTGAVDSDVVLQVFLAAQAGASGPVPTTRLVTFARVALAAGATTTVTFPPITPAARAVMRPAGGNASDIFDIAGKRWAEAGVLSFRIVTGEHGGDRAGGLAFDVRQTASQDLATC